MKHSSLEHRFQEDIVQVTNVMIETKNIIKPKFLVVSSDYRDIPLHFADTNVHVYLGRFAFNETRVSLKH